MYPDTFPGVRRRQLDQNPAEDPRATHVDFDLRTRDCRDVHDVDWCVARYERGNGPVPDRVREKLPCSSYHCVLGLW